MSNNTTTSTKPSRDPNKYIVNDISSTTKNQSPSSNIGNANSVQPQKTSSSGNANVRQKPQSIGHYILGK